MLLSERTRTARIEALDVIRGFALAGVLAINAPYFAAPMPAVINPAQPPLAVDSASLWSWFAPYVLFEFKCITLFSILFGVSLYLVGGEVGDRSKGATLRRRLGWLALFGLLHGVLLWYGDILLSYAITGFLVLGARSWKPRRLLAVGIALVCASQLVVWLMSASAGEMSPAERAAELAQSWSPPPERVAREIAAHQRDFQTAQLLNLVAWAEQQLQVLLLLTSRTAGMMMIGLGLFKAGFFSGVWRSRAYLGLIALGVLCLGALGVYAAHAARNGFPFEEMQAGLGLTTGALSPFVSLGYASVIILIVRRGAASWLTAPFAAVGRMAFTNYISQSIVLSTLFWGGRGFGLYGEVSRPALMMIAASLFAAQMVFSTYWLRFFAMGPFEWVWRRLTHGRFVSLSWKGDAPADARPAESVGAPSETRPLAIESVGLGKQFGSRWAVANLDLHVPQGAIYGFLGRNGAGKTTTIRLVLGLMRPSAGVVSVFGCDVAQDRLGAARNVGALLEARATYDQLSGRENLDLTRRMLQLPPREVDRVLELVDLGHEADRKAAHYSLGMRQRLGLARAMLGSPRLLVLDEPMNGLDPDGIRDMRETIRSLPERSGVTVFLSSHLLAEVQQVATHFGLMRDGGLAMQGPASDLLRLSSAMLFVRTSAPQKARAVLAAAGFGAESEGDGLCVTEAGGESGTARVARMLVEAGIDVFEVSPRQGSLEALYMKTQHRAEAA